MNNAIVFIFIMLTSISCRGLIEDSAKNEIDKESQKTKVKFEESYKQKIELTDKANVGSLILLNSSLFHCNKIIDSIAERVEKFSNEDFNDIQEVSNLLVHSPIGDSLFTSLSNYFETANTVAKQQRTKQKIAERRLEIFKNRSVTELKSHYFGMNSRDGTLLLLRHGFKGELYSIGYEVLLDY